MIGTEKSNNESMIMNAASIICDTNQDFKFKSFAEECFRLCYYENRHLVQKVNQITRKDNISPNRIKGIIIYKKIS